MHLSQVEPVSVIGPDVLVIAAKPGYNSVADECGTAESLAKIEQALQRLTHRSVTVKYERSSEVEDVASDGRDRSTHGGKMPCRPTRWFNGCSSFSRPGRTDLNTTKPTRISRLERPRASEHGLDRESGSSRRCLVQSLENSNA